MKKSNARADGRLETAVYIGNDENGKKIYKHFYGKTQKEVKAKADELKAQLKKGIDVNAQNDTFEQWANYWLNLKKASVSAGRYDALKAKVKYFDNIKNMQTTKIKAVDIQLCINSCADGLAKATLKDAKQTVDNIFKLAIANRVLDFNPVQAVELPQAGKETLHRRALTADEQQYILNVEHRAQLPAMIMLYAGLRKGEVVPLKWSDIDFNEQTITVCKSVEYLNNTPHIKNQAKTLAGMRTIDIPQILVDFLQNEYKKRLQAGTLNINNLVCTSASGELLTKTAWKRMWSSYMLAISEYACPVDAKQIKSKYNIVQKKYAIEGFTAHNLRHTFASMLYMAGVDVLTAKEQLGHSDVQTTLNIYTHLDKQYKRKKMSKLDEFLSAQTGS